MTPEEVREVRRCVGSWARSVIVEVGGRRVDVGLLISALCLEVESARLELYVAEKALRRAAEGYKVPGAVRRGLAALDEMRGTS
jgi:hypothetical protein